MDPEVAVLDPDAIADGAAPLGVGAGAAPPGTYVLVFRVDAEATIDVGALGATAFPAGAYAYVGSAFGAGGLGRVDRHRRVAAGDHDVTHWHVDYLGSHPSVTLGAVVAAPGVDVECRTATELRRRLGESPTDDAAGPVAGFGASDCGCPTHLVAGDGPAWVRTAAVESFRAVTAASRSEG